MLKTLSLAAVLAATTTAAAFAMPAQEFVDKAAVGGMFEVQSSKTALDRSQDDGVRQFADEMVSDHTAANETLKSIARQEGLSVPSELDEEHQQKMEELEGAQDDFNSTYVTMQVEAHEKTIDLFETFAAEGDNEALQAFAQETLPTLREHHEDATGLAQVVKAQK